MLAVLNNLTVTQCWRPKNNLGGNFLGYTETLMIELLVDNICHRNESSHKCVK